MSLVELSLKSAFKQFLETLPPGMVEENETLIKSLGIDEYLPYYLIGITKIPGDYSPGIEVVATEKEKIIDCLVQSFLIQIDNLQYYEKEERSGLFEKVIENINLLTGKKCEDFTDQALLAYLNGPFCKDIVLKEMDIEIEMGRLIITKRASVLANIMAECIDVE